MIKSWHMPSFYSILPQLRNQYCYILSINYNDPNNYNHFHNTIKKIADQSQSQSHLFNLMSETECDEFLNILYNKILINERINNKNFFFQQVACITANRSETSGAFLNSTPQSFYNKYDNNEFSTLLCPRYNLDLEYIPTNLP